MKHLALALFLLAALACARQPAPKPVAPVQPVPPQLHQLVDLYDDFQTFKNDRHYLRYGFTANFPRADWLDRVQRLEKSPELAQGAELLAHLAVAHRIHGAGSVVTKGFETRFTALLHPAPEPVQPPAQNATNAFNATEPDKTDTAQAVLERILQDAGSIQNASDAANAAPPDGAKTAQALLVPVIQDDGQERNATDAANAAVSSTSETAQVLPPTVIQDDGQEQNATDAANATVSGTSETAQVLPATVIQADGQERNVTDAANATVSGTSETAQVLPATVIQVDGQERNVTDAANADISGASETAQVLPATVIQADGQERNVTDAANATVSGASETAQVLPATVPQDDGQEQNATDAANAAISGASRTAQLSPATVIQDDGQEQNATDAANATTHGGSNPAQALTTSTVQASAPATSPARTEQPPTEGPDPRHSAEVPGPGNEHSVTLLFSGDTQGVIYPQPGLSGTVGGIARRGPLIDHMRVQTPTPLLVDAGDAFTSGFPKAERINKTLVRAMNRMGYDAMGLGRHDLSMGEVRLRELVSIAAFPFVCTNLRFHEGVKPWIRDHVILTRNGVRVAVISLLPPEAEFRVTAASLVPSGPALRAVLPKLAGRADCIVLLTQMNNAEAAALPGVNPAVSVVIGDFRSTSRGDLPYIPPLSKGLGIGMVRLERMNTGTFRAAAPLPLLTGSDEDPELVRLLEELRN